MKHIDVSIKFANYTLEDGFPANKESFERFVKHLIATTTEMYICDHDLSIGDYVEVNYKSGGGVSGKVVEFSPYHSQAKTESGWCFHEGDTITKHTPSLLPTTDKK